MKICTHTCLRGDGIVCPDDECDRENGVLPSPSPTDGAEDALNRMKRAYARNTGCHLTAEMIDSLAVTIVGQVWLEEDTRVTARKRKPETA